MSIIDTTVEYVKAELSGNDASHDWFHIERVWKLAMAIAEEEQVEDKVSVALAAILHDLKDFKYSGSETAGAEAAGEFLLAHGHPQDKIERIQFVIQNLSFKNELAARADPAALADPVLCCVQDADRLDAIGAIGIARCLTYGGSRNRILYDPAIPPVIGISKEQYMANSASVGKSNTTTMNHFPEKLLLLKDKMKTKAGRRIAEERHKFMEEYLSRFFLEIDGKA